MNAARYIISKDYPYKCKRIEGKIKNRKPKKQNHKLKIRAINAYFILYSNFFNMVIFFGSF